MVSKLTNVITGLGSGGAAQAFTWLLNLSTVAGLIAWVSLCTRSHHSCTR